MAMKTNTFKAALSERRLQIGTWINMVWNPSILTLLKSIGLEAQPPMASLYIWARVPEGYTSLDLATELLETVGVVVTPGTGYGKNGEGYIRLSLTIPDASVVKGLSRLSEWRSGRRETKAKAT